MWMRLTISVRARPSSSRRSTSSRSATVASSATTARRPGLRSPATATLWASTGSVLRPWPVSNTRTRADSFAGHVQDGLAVGDQALGDVPADPGAALHRPDPVRDTAAGGEHLLVAVGVRAVPALRQHGLLLGRC